MQTAVCQTTERYSALRTTELSSQGETEEPQCPSLSESHQSERLCAVRSQGSDILEKAQPWRQRNGCQGLGSRETVGSQRI